MVDEMRSRIGRLAHVTAKVMGAVALVGAFATLGTAAALAEPVQSIRAAPGPGPARYDRVRVERFGAASASRVLVLVPGIEAGAGEFAPLARSLVERIPDLQVWAFDPRWNAFEDTTVFATGDPGAAFDYYLRFQPNGDRRFQPLTGGQAPFMFRWGLRLYVEDLRHVVRLARAGGRRVFLGGHSFGASVATVYACWDFDGRPGYKDLAGLVLIDAGYEPGLRSLSAKGARRELRRLHHAGPLLSTLKGLPPWAGGVFLEAASLYARALPDDTSAMQFYPLIPRAFRPKTPVTNEALLGYALDRDSAPSSFATLRIRAGGLANGADPRGWADGELSSVQTVAEAFSREPVNGASWFPPRRAALDMSAADALSRTPAARVLGLRVWHRRTLALPVFALQTDRSRSYFLHNTRVLMRLSKVRARDSVLLDRADAMDSLDPLFAAPDRNPLVQELGRFMAGSE